MSQTLSDVIPVMNLLQEMRERDYQVICTEPHVYCKIFEDNSDALETSLRVRKSNYCTPELVGLLRYTLRYGPTPCAMPHSSTIAFR